MFERLKAYPIFLILSWSLLVHLPGITSPLLDYHAHRQCQTASMARNYFRHGMHFLNPELDNYGVPQRAGTEFPIYSYLLALLYQLFGVHETLGRLLSAAFAAWGAVYLFLFIRPRLGETVALGSSLIMCVIPVHLYFTRTVQPESMALWGFLAFLFYGDRALREKRPQYFLLTILCGALPCLLKLSFIYLIGGMWALMVWEQCQTRVDRIVKGGAILLAMTGLTLIWYHYTKTAFIQPLPLDAVSNLENLLPFFTWHLWITHIVSRFPEIYATYPGVLLGGLGVWALHQKKQLRFFGLWLVITFGYEGLLGAYGLHHKYTAIPFAPIMGVLITMGAVTLWEHRQAWHCPSWLVGVLLIGIPVHAALRIGHWYTLERLWLFDAHERLVALNHPDDLILTNTAEHPVLLYYLDHYGYANALEETSRSTVDKILNDPQVKFFVTPKEPRWEIHPGWRRYFEKKGVCVVDQPDYLIYALNSKVSLRER